MTDEHHHTHRVVCAAIKHPDGRIVCGVRHYDQLMIKVLECMQDMWSDGWRGAEQGFVDNRYNFLTREQAYTLALNAFQLDPDSTDYRGIRGTLFSEDVW